MMRKVFSSLLGAALACAGLASPASAVQPLPANVGPINCKTMNVANIGITADSNGYTSIPPFPASGGVFTAAATYTVDLPANGVICLKSIGASSGTLTFKRNAANTPVYILVEEYIDMGTRYFSVDGAIGASYTGIGMTYRGGLGGPGGSDGGSCDFGVPGSFRAGEGIGPGGGKAAFRDTTGGGGGASPIRNGLRGGSNTGVLTGAAGGLAYSEVDDRLLHGGSGGGCGNQGATTASTNGYGGSGGGGVLVVAAGQHINTNGGYFNARGGAQNAAGGAGGGGAVRLISPQIYGAGFIDVRGGATAVGWSTLPTCGSYGGCGGTGLIKLEGYDISGLFLYYIHRTQGEFANDNDPEASIRFGTPQPIWLPTAQIPTVEVINVQADFSGVTENQQPPPVDYSVHPYTTPGMYFRSAQVLTVTIRTKHVPTNATIYLRMNGMDPTEYLNGNPAALAEISGDGGDGTGVGANPVKVSPTVYDWTGTLTVPTDAEIGDIEAWVASVCTPGTTGCAAVP